MIEWIVGIILVILFGIFGIGWYFSSKIIQPNTRSHEFAYQHEVDHGTFDSSTYEALPRPECCDFFPIWL